jgi:hypothetical protein
MEAHNINNITLLLAKYSLQDGLLDSIEFKDVISLLALLLSVVSLVATYLTNQRLEKYKAIIEFEKKYLEDKIKEEKNQIKELIQSFRDARLIIEKIIIRSGSPVNGSIEEISTRLEEKYTNLLLFLKDAKNTNIVVLIHEQKNRLRNNLEDITLGSYLTDASKRLEIETNLTRIKTKEVEVVDKLNIIYASLFDTCKKQMRN